MVDAAAPGRPPCPFCGEARCVLVRPKDGRTIGETCGNRTCAAKLRAQRLGPAHYKKLQRACAARRKSKKWTPEYASAYNSGLATGRRRGFKEGYEAAKAEMETGSHG